MKFVFPQEGKIAGRAVLIAGQPGTGKTAIAMGKMKIYFIVVLRDPGFGDNSFIHNFTVHDFFIYSCILPYFIFWTDF